MCGWMRVACALPLDPAEPARGSAGLDGYVMFCNPQCNYISSGSTTNGWGDGGATDPQTSGGSAASQ